MRITTQAYIESEQGGATRVVTVGVVERDLDFAPSSGLGLFVREAHSVLEQIQAVVLDEQVEQFASAASRCRGCDAQLGLKDTKTLVYRTAYGKSSRQSPRLYGHCSKCSTCVGERETFSPLADALPQRVHPQWTWLQCRYASVMSYRLAQIFLRDAFPGGRQLPTSSVAVNVRAVGHLSQSCVLMVRPSRAGCGRLRPNTRHAKSARCSSASTCFTALRFKNTWETSLISSCVVTRAD